jgi:hypothetical protein
LRECVYTKRFDKSAFVEFLDTRVPFELALLDAPVMKLFMAELCELQLWHTGMDFLPVNFYAYVAALHYYKCMSRTMMTLNEAHISVPMRFLLDDITAVKSTSAAEVMEIVRLCEGKTGFEQFVNVLRNSKYVFLCRRKHLSVGHGSSHVSVYEFRYERRASDNG